MPKTVEQHLRDILSVAIEEDLVREGDVHPIDFNSGDMTETANALAEALLEARRLGAEAVCDLLNDMAGEST